MSQVDYSHQPITLDQANCLSKRQMSRQEDCAQIARHQSHSVLLGTGEMGEEFGVPGKTVAAEEKRAFIYRRRGNRIDAAGGAEFHGRFDVTGSCFACGAGFNSRFNIATHVVEVKDDWID